ANNAVDETDVRGAVQRVCGEDGTHLGGPVLVAGCGWGAAGVGGGGVLGCGGGGGGNANTGGPDTAERGQPPEEGKGGENSFFTQNSLPFRVTPRLTGKTRP
ncbi:MAG: hypothetical protein LBF77_11075, partial [Spirochaetaceae bacterium]|nr:hypothetical protein [Spirochaetaceae bacterium]